MSKTPWPESNPHPERGPLWVQWYADNDETDPRRHRFRRDGSLLDVWLSDADADAIARQLGQECPPPSTKKVLWKHAIGERLPDGREITGARCCNDGSVVIEADGPDGIHVAGALDGPDGMVEVLA